MAHSRSRGVLFSARFGGVAADGSGVFGYWFWVQASRGFSRYSHHDGSGTAFLWLDAFDQLEDMDMRPWPNKSPEPTAVGAVSSAVAVHAASRRWLSFFR